MTLPVELHGRVLQFPFILMPRETFSQVVEEESIPVMDMPVTCACAAPAASRAAMGRSFRKRAVRLECAVGGQYGMRNLVHARFSLRWLEGLGRNRLLIQPAGGTRVRV